MATGTAYDQPTNAPTSKVAAGGVAGAAALVISYIVQTVFGIELPMLVAEAFVLVLSFGAAYFTRDKR